MNSIKIADLYATLELKGSKKLKSAISGTNAKMSQLGSSLNGAAAQSSGMAASMGMAGGAAARLSAVAMPLAAGLAVVGGGLAAVINKTADASTELMNLNQRTGLNVEALQEFKHVSSMAGVEYDQFTKGIEVFNRKMIEVEAGTGRTADTLQEMGIATHGPNGNMRDMSAMLPEIMKELNQMDDTTRRNAYASQLFGRNTEAMLPIISMGADGIKQAREEARKLGMVQSGESVAAADKFNKSISKLAERARAAGRSFAYDLYPTLNDYVIPGIRALIPVAQKVAGVFKFVGTQIFESLKEKITPVFEAMWKGFVKFQNGFADAYNHTIRPALKAMGYDTQRVAKIGVNYFDKFRVSMEDFEDQSKQTADQYEADVARMQAAATGGNIPGWAGKSDYIKSRLQATGTSNISELRGVNISESANNSTKATKDIQSKQNTTNGLLSQILNSLDEANKTFEEKLPERVADAVTKAVNGQAGGRYTVNQCQVRIR
jgi:hypothetical protein